MTGLRDTRRLNCNLLIRGPFKQACDEGLRATSRVCSGCRFLCDENCEFQPLTGHSFPCERRRRAQEMAEWIQALLNFGATGDNQVRFIQSCRLVSC